MANILNVSKNVFKNLKDEKFFNSFVNKSYLSIGDIISVINKPLQDYIIIGPNNTKIYNNKFKTMTNSSIFFSSPGLPFLPHTLGTRSARIRREMTLSLSISYNAM